VVRNGAVPTVEGMSTEPDPLAGVLSDVVEDERPWGRFRQYTHKQPTTVKVICVRDGEALSLQRISIGRTLGRAR
jgi:hypothetical protein